MHLRKPCWRHALTSLWLIASRCTFGAASGAPQVTKLEVVICLTWGGSIKSQSINSGETQYMLARWNTDLSPKNYCGATFRKLQKFKNLHQKLINWSNFPIKASKTICSSTTTFKSRGCCWPANDSNPRQSVLVFEKCLSYLTLRQRRGIQNKPINWSKNKNKR